MKGKNLIALVSLGFACMTHGQVYLDRGQTILVPPSSVKARGAVHTNYVINLAPKPVSHFGGSDGIHPHISLSGLFPADIRTAYEIPPLAGSGAIAIVDAGDNTTILADFKTFSSNFGLRNETSTNATLSTNKVFQVVYAGGVQPPAIAGWDGEIALDVEWAHAVAPNAKIYLVEAASSSLFDLEAAVNLAKTLPGVKEVSMSWGASEFLSQGLVDPDYAQSGVAFFASTGDHSDIEYPSTSPNVVAVGGTSLSFAGGVTTETAWSSTGGGISAQSAIPSYQSTLSAILGAKRGVPDISGYADANPGVAVFSTSAFNGWSTVGGTSVACPMMAGMANARGSYSSSSVAENLRNYTNLGSTAFRDIKSGTSGSNSAVVGWDATTGCGSPLGLLPQSQANPTNVKPAYGTLAGGTLSSLFTENGLSYDTLSAPSTDIVGQYASDYVLVHFASAPSAYRALYFFVTASATANSTYTLQAYNYTSKKYLQFGSGALTSTPKNFIYLLNVGPAASYVDANNTVHLILKSRTPGYNATSHTMKLDRVVGYVVN